MKKLTLSLLIAIIILIGFVAVNSSGSKKEEVKNTPVIPVATSTPQAATPQITIKPATILPGDPVLITIESNSKPTAILWNTKNISMFEYEGKTRALVPIDFNEKVLEHTVTVTFKNDETIRKAVKITPREKIERPLGIPEKLGGNTPEAAQTLVNNLANENRIINTIKTATTTLWTQPFRYPVAMVYITDDYGYDRKTVERTIVHKGTDFRAQVGTEVRAMNRGIVRIARTFTVYGNTVVIDHGLGVQTLYMHLSALNVKEGETVEAGDIIGKSGDTGYVEAPHLHISVKINAVSVDPMTFLRFF